MFKAPANVATFFLRIPLAAMFMQQGLSKLPVTGTVAEAWGLPYIVWWFVTWGEIGAAIGLIVGGILGLIPWHAKHFFDMYSNWCYMDIKSRKYMGRYI